MSTQLDRQHTVTEPGQGRRARSQDEALQFGLLGPIEARRGSAGLDLGPLKRRLLLTRLLLEEGHPVPADRLCEDLWEGRPPSAAISSLHSHVSRLRAVLEPQRRSRSQGTVLVSGSTGYVLNAPRGARDTARFEAAAQGARELLGHGHMQQAEQEVDRALSMWRGGALADAADHAFAAREIRRLEETRLAAEELRATILFQQNKLQETIVATEDLTTRSPLRETAWILLMRALYLTGRPAEALHRFESVRRALAKDLGIDPSPQLRETHLAVLRHNSAALAPELAAGVILTRPQPMPLMGSAVPDRDPAFDPDAKQKATVPDGPTAAVPGHRPEPVLRSAGATESRIGSRTGNAPEPRQPVVGRAAELARLEELLAGAATNRASWALVSGEAGIGRTRLAEELAARAAEAGFAVAWARCGPEMENGQDSLAFRPAGQLLAALDPQRGLDVRPEDVTRDLAELLSRRPTVCVIDDLHYASDDFRQTLLLFATLLKDLPLMVLCTVQDDTTEDTGLGEHLALLIRRGGAVTLPLTSLSVADVQELLDRQGGALDSAPEPGSPLAAAPPAAASAPPGQAVALHRRSEGNPFFLTELLKLPSEQRTGPRAQVPASLRRVLKARLDGLSEPALALLETLAVADGRLDVELATEVRATSREELLSLIDTAVTARVLVWEEDGSKGRFGGYRLPDLPRQVILDGLTVSRRQALHAAVAKALFQLPGRHPVQVARHLMAAGPLVAREDVALAALRSGRRCAEEEHYAEAELWLEHAASLTRRPDVRAEAVHALRACRVHLRRFRNQAQEAGDRDAAALPSRS
ncbi:BTAD domain-containing putative transcriptional regulator [Streptomyces fuscichromogenes]|uniref:BTAD domain-containing putative transcriptional regulator n=1 Tax=Streptomyces fuscichromogenes TaxID=1324013 RepID=UPI0037FA329F